jgi:hypothetical protein
MTTDSKLNDLLDEFEEAGVLEDRREYSVEDLRLSELLTQQEAEDLYWLVQRETTEKHHLAYGFLSDQLAMPTARQAFAEAPLLYAFLEGILESIHGGLDGWDSEHDRILIQRYLSDIVTYTRHAIDK